MSGRGRKPKYTNIIALLEKHTLYTPASIASFAKRHRHLPVGIDEEKAYLRLRIATARMAKNKKFPREGDGNIFQEGQPALPAWFGWRWHKAYSVNTPISSN